MLNFISPTNVIGLPAEEYARLLKLARQCFMSIVKLVASS